MPNEDLRKPAIGAGTTRFRDAVIYVGGMLFQQSLGLVAGVLIARSLGPADYGVLSVVRNAFAIVIILTPLGLNISLLRHVTENKDAVPRFMTQLRFLRIAVAAITVAIVLALFFGVGGWLEAHVYKYQDFGLYLSLIFVGLPFATDALIVSTLFRARHRPAVQVLVTSYLEPAVRLAAVILALWLGLGLAGVVSATPTAYVFSYLALNIALAISLVPRSGPRHRLDGADAKALKSLLTYSLWLATAALVYSALRNVDVLLLGIFRSAKDVGQYAVLSTVAQLIQIYPQAISQTLGPIVAGRYFADDLDGVKQALNSYLRWASLLSAPVFAGVAVLGPWLDLVFGRQFSFSPAISLGLALGYLVAAVLAPMGYSLSMTGRHRQEFAILATGTAITSIACLVIIPPFGAVGAAFTIAGGFILVNAARAFAVHRIFRITLGRASDALPPLVALALAWACLSAGEAVLGRNLLSLIVVATVFVLISAAVGWLFLLRRDERAYIKDWLWPRLSRFVNRSRRAQAP